MKQVEILIVFLSNDDEALFVNGTKIYSASGYDRCMSAQSVGDALAATLGVAAFTIEAPMPSYPEWTWEDVYASFTRCSLPARAFITDSVRVANSEVHAKLSHASKPFSMNVTDERLSNGTVTVTAAPVAWEAKHGLEAKISIERHPDGHDVQAVTVRSGLLPETLRICFDPDKFLICTNAGVEVLGESTMQSNAAVAVQ